MDVAGVTSATSASTQTSETSMLSGLSAADFMSILIQELQYQDPFEPMSNQEMAEQISTISELEMNTRVTEKLEQLTDSQRYGAAAALIGKYAKGTVTDSEGTEFSVEGIVTGVRFNSTGDVLIELDTGELLPLESVSSISEAEQYV